MRKTYIFLLLMVIILPSIGLARYEYCVCVCVCVCLGGGSTCLLTRTSMTTCMLYQYIKILLVCLCVRDGCGRGNSLKLLLLGHSELNATRGMPSWALAIALATDKNTRSFAVLNQKEIRFFTYVSQRAGGEAATVRTSD